MRDQIRKACCSIMSNIAEGYERKSKKEFIQFPAIAKGSVGEVRSQLYIALDRHYILKDSFDELFSMTSEISRMINGLITYYSGNKIVDI